MIPVIITPINPTTSAPAVGISAAGISGNAPQVPSAISAVPPGSFLQGFVLNRNSAGNPTLRTELGDFILQSSLFLKIGSSVVVRVDASGANFRAHITEVDGQPVNPDPKTPAHVAPQKSEGDQIVRSGWIPQTGDASPKGKSAELNAVLLTPNSTAATAQLKEGTALLVRLFNIQLPNIPTQTQPPVNTTPTTAQNANANPALVTTPNTPPSAAATPAQPPVSGGNTQVHTSPAAQPAPANPSTIPSATLLPDAHAQNIAAQNIPKQAMLLTVIGQERDGEPVLQTPFGLIKITSNATLATGTQLQATLALANAAGSEAVLQSPEKGATLTSLAQKWPGLAQIISILTEANEGVLPSQLASLLPQLQVSPTQIQINNARDGGLFMFLAALQGGDFKNILGERNIKQLEKLGHTSLLNKVDGEFQMLSKLAASPPQQGWQTMFLPVMVEGQLEMMRWFTKRDQEKDKDGKRREDSVTRFIVEVTMSQLGDIQLDGLFKTKPEAKQFELIVRSHQPLDAEIQQNIQKIYQDAGSVTNVTGSVVFLASERFPTLPLEDILGGPPDVFA